MLFLIEILLRQEVLNPLQGLLELGKNRGCEGGVVGCSDGRHADFSKNLQIACGAHVWTGHSLLCYFEFKAQKGIDNARFAFTTR